MGHYVAILHIIFLLIIMPEFRERFNPPTYMIDTLIGVFIVDRALLVFRGYQKINLVSYLEIALKKRNLISFVQATCND
jgi:hypothetical protein